MAYSNVTPPALPDYSPVTGYSYNGVELPALPEWDKETYPYAYIIDEDINYNTYFLVYAANESTSVLGDLSFVMYQKSVRYKLLDGSWVSVGISGAAGGRAIWCNTDIYYSGNTQNGELAETLYLPASDPVPIEPYPYSVIAYNYEKGAEDWYQAHLYYSATPFTWNGTAVVNSGTTYKRIYDAELDAWTDEAETEIEATPGLDGTVYQRIYTGHDILDSTGAVWLAAGQVTPVEETGVSDTWKYSFKLGLALALCGKPLPIVRKLIGYSYNGTVLPKLPEWDKTAYPYAFICKRGFGYRIDLWQVLPVSAGIDSGYGVTGEDVAILTATSVVGGTGWSDLVEDVVIDTNRSRPIWGNTDLYTADGSLALSASEPVPVYE